MECVVPREWEPAEADEPSKKRAKVVTPVGDDEDGADRMPLAQVFTIHQAIRRNLETLNAKVESLSTVSTEQSVGEVAARLSFFKRMMDRHCETEDSILYPALISKLSDSGLQNSPEVENFLNMWKKKHDDLNSMFDRTAELITSLHEANEPSKENDVFATLETLKASQSVHLSEAVIGHIEEEEAILLPLFRKLFTAAEQGQLLVSNVTSLQAAPLLAWTVRALSESEKIRFLSVFEKYSTEEQLADVASHIAHDLPGKDWRSLCTALPSLSKVASRKACPLIEIRHIHKAIRRELADLVKFCKNLDPCDDAQLQSLIIRFKFLGTVHKCHSAGEDQVILKELDRRLCVVTQSLSDLHEQHDDEAALFVKLSDMVEKMMAVDQSNESLRQTEKRALVDMMDRFAQHLLKHMEDEEKNVLPLVEKHFSVEDQDQLVRRAMAKVPNDFRPDLIQWCLAALSLDEQEMLLRNVLRSATQEEFQNIAIAVAMSVQRGEKCRWEWDELCLRIPELQMQSKGASETCVFTDDSPINEILRVHKAIRIELNGILETSEGLSENINPNGVSALAERCNFLGRMVYYHSKAEDSIVLPLLESRVKNISQSYHDEHSDERRLFDSLSKHLEMLQCTGETEGAGDVAMNVYVLARTLRDDMLQHLKQEETHLWPILVENFSIEEQCEVVSMIVGQMPSEILQEMLPWMIRVLTVSEREDMMNQFSAVTGSTLFEKWLQTWLPVKRNESKPEETSQEDTKVETEEGAAVALVLLQGKEDVQRAVRLVAADKALSVEQKTRLMQNLLLPRWMQNNPSEQTQLEVPKSDRVPSYVELENGEKVYGCKHYQRGCKVRTKCCGRLFSCRLCHDAESSHTMNRYQTEEVWCMRCDTLQPVSNKCINCSLDFARFFCRVCRLYEDNKSRDVYHCHSCNVCRVGKGLGRDYFHCMKCNACISLKHTNHKCIEKVMESNCPICNNYLFSSTTPIKYLSCGHLMHQQCYEQYEKVAYRCPLCQKSLGDMTSHYKRLNIMLSREQMPAEYRSARAKIYCNDCSTHSLVPFHFLYIQCPGCQSYNTDLVNIDANGGDHHKLLPEHPL